MSREGGLACEEVQRRILHHEDSGSQIDQHRMQCDESLIVCLSFFSTLAIGGPHQSQPDAHPYLPKPNLDTTAGPSPHLTDGTDSGIQWRLLRGRYHTKAERSERYEQIKALRTRADKRLKHYRHTETAIQKKLS